MAEDKNIIRLGKNLAFLLRHDADAFKEGLIDEHGWRNVSELKKRGYTQSILDEIVETNNKQRYEYNESKTKIRARQGHSIPVDVELVEMTPPDTLYHGTATRFITSIMGEGIKCGTRLYVHLSKDVETAKTVGARHGNPCVIELDAKKMSEDGIKFFLSNNGVWLTKHVPTNYFKNVQFFTD